LECPVEKVPDILWVMAKTAYIKIIPSHAKNIRYEAGEERIQAMTREDWIRLVEDIRRLGQGNDAGQGVLERLREEHDYDKGAAKMEMSSLRRNLQNTLKNFRRDLEATYIPEQDVFYLEYDPTEWFSTPGRSFGAHVSGRMFSLAAAGVLQAQGIPVYGTGLAEEPTELI